MNNKLHQNPKATAFSQSPMVAPQDDVNLRYLLPFGDRVYAFYQQFHAHNPPEQSNLPEGVEVMNPYQNPATLACVKQFCSAFYTGNNERLGCFGINPGRFGGGLTGLAFTDPVVLREVCQIPNALGTKRELSAEFVWRVIEAFGGARPFFQSVFLTALCPLGFTKQGVNYNFYDDPILQASVTPFILHTLQEQIALGLRRDVAVCFGTGKLYKAFEALNRAHGFFERLVALEHPRFIMQYRKHEVPNFVQKYVQTLTTLLCY